MKHTITSFMLLIAAMLMSSAALLAQSYDIVYGEGAGSMYFKLHPSDDPDQRYAEMVAGPYQYSGIVTVPNDVTKDDIEYPVTVIATKCFANCKLLKQVILGDNVKTIKNQAFYYSGDASGNKDYKGTTRNGIIINLDAPSLTTIEAGSFSSTSITPEDGVMRIGKKVTSMDNNSTSLFSWARFYGNKIEVAEGNQSYVVGTDGVLYDKNMTKLVLFPYYAGGVDYTTPATVKRVLSHSMYDFSSSLKSFTDGGGLEYVGSIGWGCAKITLGKKLTSLSEQYRLCSATNLNLTIDAENTKYRVITDANGNKGLYELKDGVPYKLLKSFQTNGKSGSYGSDTFILPTTVTHIASLAFYQCTSLKYVDCQNSEVLLAENIDNSAAPAPVSIKYINISLYKELEGQEGIEYTKDTKKLVNWSSEAKVVDYVMPNEVTSIAGAGMHDNQYAKTFDIGQNLKIGNNDGYFFRLKNLEKFTASNGNKNGLFVYDDALYMKESGNKISMISYPSGRKKMIYTVADGTQYLSGNTGTPSVRSFDNKYLRAVDLGDDMVEIRYNSMNGMTKLAVVRLAAPVPPVASSGSFAGTASATTKKTLCVPLELMDIYKENSVFNTCFKFFAEESEYEEKIREIEVEYDVEHLKQNIDDDEYTSTIQPKVIGNLLCSTKAANYVYTGSQIKGFHVVKIEDIILEEDGVTAKIYYDRDTYKVTWKNGDKVVAEATERYQKPLVAPEASKVVAPAGKSFFGWHTNPESTMALTFDGAKYEEDVTYYALFSDNATVKYTVKHLLQNLNDNNYTEDAKARVESEGIWGTETKAAAKTYPGFKAQAVKQVTIAEDGSTVVEIKYDRNNYTVTWMNGSSKISSATERYETALTAPAAPTATAGKHFIGWNTDKNAQAAITLPTKYEADATYYAIFVDNESVAYTIKHMQQNVAGNAYDLKESESGRGIAGTQTTAKAKEYTGFTAQTFAQKAIAEDGSTVIEIKYNRNKYNIVWKNGETTISTNNLVYGATITAPTAPTAPAGKHFVGWNTDKNATGALTLTGATVEGDATYYAIILDNATVDYTVVHKTQKLDGTYEVKAQSTGRGIAGLKTNATANTYDGFTAQAFDQKTIAENGSTIVEIQYTRNSYDLKYENLQDATISNKTKYTQAGKVKFETALVIPTLSRTGYSYQWSSIPPATMPSEALTLTVVWNANSYKDYWDFNDGKGGSVTGETKFGEVIRKPDAILTKEGYDFVGWARKETPSVVIENDNFGTMPAKDVNFIAVWKLKNFSYTVSHKFEALDGTFVENESMRETKSADYGTQTTAAAKSIEGFTAREITQKSVESDGIEIVILYDRNSYMLTWVNEKSEAVVTNEAAYTKSGTIKYGAAVVAPEYTLEGYTYKWSEAIPSTMPAKDVTLKVTFEAITYNIKVAENIEGCDKVTVAKSAKYGETVEISSITAKAGYELTGVATDKAQVVKNGDKYSFVMPASDVTITPAFKKIAYSITVNAAEDGGTVTASAETATMGEEITFSIIAKKGWQIKSMSSNATISISQDKSSAVMTMPAANVEVTPEFEKINYTIKVGDVKNGTLTVDGGKKAAQAGEMVKVTYEPKAGYHFNTFLVNDNEYVLTDNGEFEMPAENVTLSATFSATGYGITIKNIDGGTIKAEKTSDVNVDEEVKLTIETWDGYEFADMETTCGTISIADDKKSAVLTMGAGNATITPSFNKLGYTINFTANDGNNVDVLIGEKKETVASVGDEVTVVFNPLKGFEFKSIEADGVEFTTTSSSAKFDMPAKNVSGTVVFSRKSYGILVHGATYGTVKAPETATFGDIVKLDIEAEDEYAIETIEVVAVEGEERTAVECADGTFIMPAANVEISATFAKKKYPIKIYVTGPGKLAAAAESASIGEQVKISIMPEEGSKLESDPDVAGASWTYSEDKKSFTITVEESSIVVSATFVDGIYNIEAKGNGHCNIEAPATAKYKDEVAIEVTPDAGYEIEAITIDETEIEINEENKYSFSMPSHDVEINVTTKAIEYTITVGDIENGEVEVYRGIAHVGDEIEVGYEPAEGFHLVNIYVNGEVKALTEKNTFTMPAENVVITAKFSETGYGISVMEVEGGTVVPSVYEANVGDVVDLKIVPETGYEFASMSLVEGQKGKITDIDAKALTAKLTMAAENATIVPVFKKIGYSIELTTDKPNAVECVSTASYGEKVTVAFKADKGYKFGKISAEGIDFSVSADMQSATFTMPAADVKGTVEFAKIDYKITYAEAENGVVSGATTANYGDEVEITIAPAEHYELSNLTAANGGKIVIDAEKQKATLTMEAANEIISAVFVKTLHSIILKGSENGTLEADKSEAGYGDKVTLIAKPNDKYELEYISVNGEYLTIPENGPITFDMPGNDVEIEATFVEMTCGYYKAAKAVAYYNWLLIVDKNDLEAKGETIDDSMVKWYKVVGELDDPCDDNAIKDDEEVKSGLYFTSETNLKGSGDYYAVIETAKERYRTEVFYFAGKKATVSMAPTRAYRGQTLKIKGLADEATIAVYDINGRLLRVINTQDTETFDLQAEDNNGMYIVNIITDGEEHSIKYIVK
ncbi:MAG: InlB B-repeat-containing protein [Bacteroidales bacterium]|nr:InlB B-repeat-containing protein [Bacteroidales bacterium]